MKRPRQLYSLPFESALGNLLLAALHYATPLFRTDGRPAVDAFYALQKAFCIRLVGEMICDRREGNGAAMSCNHADSFFWGESLA